MIGSHSPHPPPHALTPLLLEPEPRPDTGTDDQEEKSHAEDIRDERDGYEDGEDAERKTDQGDNPAHWADRYCT